MISKTFCSLLCLYTITRVDCIISKERNTTVDLLPGTLVRLANPPRTDKLKDRTLICWYIVRLAQGVSGGVFRISVDRFSIGRLEKHVCVGGHLQV